MHVVKTVGILILLQLHSLVYILVLILFYNAAIVWQPKSLREGGRMTKMYIYVSQVIVAKCIQSCLHLSLC